MRELPQKISIIEFATALGCSLDTAKRWLRKSLGTHYVEVLRSKGGHMSVRLPLGETSLIWCRIARCYDKFTDRKRVASQAMPKLHVPRRDKRNCIIEALPSAETDFISISTLTGANALWVRGDLHGLIQQVAEELMGKPQDLIRPSEEEIMKSVSFFYLLRAAYALQKDEVKLTASALAKYLGISLASLYREPFGCKKVQDVFSQAENNTAAHHQASFEEKVMVSQGCAIKQPRPKIPYSKRKLAFDRRRESKARHFLFWQVVELQGGGRMASLYLVPETQIPESLRPRCKTKRGCSLPIYAKAELNRILAWLKTNGFELNKDLLGGFRPIENPSMYSWDCRYGGQRSGKEQNWKAAAKEIIVQVSRLTTLKKVIILNPKRHDVYLVPECVPSASPDAPSDQSGLKRHLAENRTEIARLNFFQKHNLVVNC